MDLHFPGNVFGTDGCLGVQGQWRGFLPFSSPLCHAVVMNPDIFKPECRRTSDGNAGNASSDVATVLFMLQSCPLEY